MDTSTQTLANELEALRKEVTLLNGHRFVRLHDSTWRLMWFNFLRGLAFGFGSVAGATIVVSIVGYFIEPNRSGANHRRMGQTTGLGNHGPAPCIRSHLAAKLDQCAKNFPFAQKPPIRPHPHRNMG